MNCKWELGWLDAQSCMDETTFVKLDEDGDAITAKIWIWFGTDTPLTTVPWRRADGALDDFGEFELQAYEVLP